MAQLEAKGFFGSALSDPELCHPGRFGSSLRLGFGRRNCSAKGSTELLWFVRPVVLFKSKAHQTRCLSRLNDHGQCPRDCESRADLDFHIICVKEGIIDDEKEVNDFLMERVLPKFVDVVSMEDVLALSR